MVATTEGDWMNFSEYVTIFSLEPPAFIVPNSKKPPPIALLKLLFLIGRSSSDTMYLEVIFL